MSLLLGRMGVGGKLTSNGVYLGVKRLSSDFGWVGETYTHLARQKPLDLLYQHQGNPIVVVANSAGVNAIDRELDENPDLKIDTLFSVVSALPETITERVGKVVVVTASRDFLRNFTIKHPNIEKLKLSASHTGADDHPDLWEAVESEMKRLASKDETDMHQEFFNKVYSAARSLGADHIRAGIAAAQSAIETGWGKHLVGNSYFGVKASETWEGKVSWFDTTEHENGQIWKGKASFRAYDGLEESVRDYLSVIRGGFPDVWNADSFEAAALGLNTGKYGRYATNPNYHNDVRGTAVSRSEAARASGGASSYPAPTLRRGDIGNHVGLLLKVLEKWGYYSGPQDSIFGGGAEAAVRHFQKDAGLQIDGIVGPITWKVLDDWSEFASANAPIVVEPGVHYVNQNAIRSFRCSTYIEDTLLEGMGYCFGSGCRAEIYSGGQAIIGTSDKRTGSVRHDIDKITRRGRAGDVHLFWPNGVQIMGAALSRLAQWWLARKRGSVGLEMSGGGIHVDEWTTPPKGGALSWTYKASDGKSYADAIRKALDDGLTGIMPEKYEPKALPAPTNDISPADPVFADMHYEDMSDAKLLETIINATAEIEMATLEIRKRNQVNNYIEINPTPAIVQDKPKENTMTFDIFNFSSKTFWTGAAMFLAGLLKLIAPESALSEIVTSFFGQVEGGLLITNGLALVFGREAISKVGGK